MLKQCLSESKPSLSTDLNSDGWIDVLRRRLFFVPYRRRAIDDRRLNSAMPSSANVTTAQSRYRRTKTRLILGLPFLINDF